MGGFSFAQVSSSVRQIVHRLLSKDLATMQGVCAACGPVRLRHRSGGYVGCAIARKLSTISRADESYRHLRGKVCERCGFIPQHPTQLDGHHKDGDRTNNAPENIATLCANCHRLQNVGLLEAQYRS